MKTLTILALLLLTSCAGTLVLLQDDPKEVQDCLGIAGDFAESSYEACDKGIGECVRLAGDAAEASYKACIVEKLNE